MTSVRASVTIVSKVYGIATRAITLSTFGIPLLTIISRMIIICTGRQYRYIERLQAIPKTNTVMAIFKVIILSSSYSFITSLVTGSLRSSLLSESSSRHDGSLLGIRTCSFQTYAVVNYVLQSPEISECCNGSICP